MRHRLGRIPLVRHFKVRLELVGALGHATEETFLDSLVDAQPEELYLVQGFFLERLLERQQATVLVHHLQRASLLSPYNRASRDVINQPWPQTNALYPPRRIFERL